MRKFILLIFVVFLTSTNFVVEGKRRKRGGSKKAGSKSPRSKPAKINRDKPSRKEKPPRTGKSNSDHGSDDDRKRLMKEAASLKRKKKSKCKNNEVTRASWKR